MKKLVLVALLSSSLPAFAAPVTYNIDPSHTYPTYEINHMGFSLFHGVFKTTGGKIILDTAAKTGSVDVRVDTGSIDMGIDKLGQHLKSEDFFNIAKFPAMTFKSTKVNFNGDNPASVEGDLTILGVSKPVTLSIDYFKCAPHPFAKKPACGANERQPSSGPTSE
jgi:polyisoprenoid-binding protein YceI